MREVKLSESEVRILTGIGKLRNKNTSSVCAEQIQSTLNPTQISIDGVLSEYMVAKHKGWFFDLNCDVRQFGADFITPEGLKIDVKSTRSEGGPLNIRYTHKDKDYDFYILVELHRADKGIIVGAISARSALQESNLAVNKDGLPYFKVDRSQLKPLKGANV